MYFLALPMKGSKISNTIVATNTHGPQILVTEYNSPVKGIKRND